MKQPNNGSPIELNKSEKEQNFLKLLNGKKKTQKHKNTKTQKKKI